MRSNFEREKNRFHRRRSLLIVWWAHSIDNIGSIITIAIPMKKRMISIRKNPQPPQGTHLMLVLGPAGVDQSADRRRIGRGMGGVAGSWGSGALVGGVAAFDATHTPDRVADHRSLGDTATGTQREWKWGFCAEKRPLLGETSVF